MALQQPFQESELFDGLNILNLKVCGLWSAVNHYRVHGRTGKLITLVVAALSISTIPYEVFQFIYLFIFQMNIHKLSFYVINSLAQFEVQIKVIYFWYRIKEETYLFDLLQTNFLSSVPDQKRAKVNEIYKQTARRCNIFCFFAYTECFTACLCWILFPGYDTDASGEGRKKILSGWYPFQVSETPIYEVIFAYEILAVVTAGIIIPLYSVIIMQLMGLYAHFSVLAFLISDLRKEQTTEQISDISSNKALNSQLHAIKEDYDKLLR